MTSLKKSKVNKNAPSFVKISSHGNLSISVPLLARYTRENNHILLVRDNGTQQTRLYVYENGVYKLYSREMMLGLIKEPIELFDEELIKMRTINEAYQQIITDRQVIPQGALDSDETIINFRNGLLHLTGDKPVLKPHTPEVFSTIQLPCDWVDTPLPTPYFDQYLQTLADNNDDVMTLILQFMGLTLSNIPGYRLKKAMFFVGAGNTGKSVLRSLIEQLLGPGNYIGIDLSEIETRFGAGFLYGTRLAGCADMSTLEINELRSFKKLTGGDSISIEFKGKQAFSYKYPGVLWFASNRMPMFRGDCGRWVFDRLIIITCKNTIPPEKQDKLLLNKLYNERSGIVHRAVKALLTVIRNGYKFSEPESVIKSRKDFQAQINTAISFFDECLEIFEDDQKIDKRITTGNFYQAYRTWCRFNGYKAKTANDFRLELSYYLNAEPETLIKRVNGQSYYTGCTLTESAKMFSSH